MEEGNIKKKNDKFNMQEILFNVPCVVNCVLRGVTLLLLLSNYDSVNVFEIELLYVRTRRGDII